MKMLYDNLYDYNGHISDHALTLLKSGKLPEKNRIEMLEHIGCCEECADKISQCFDEPLLMALPNDFSQNICSRINTLETKKQQRSFVLYCVRIAAAVCITLYCIYSGIFNTTIGFLQQNVTINVKAPDLSFTDKIVRDISGITNNIIKMEGSNNVNKEG